MRTQIYLITGEQRDGEHERTVRCLLRARTESGLARQTNQLFKREDSSPYALDHEKAYFGYGDGLTATKHVQTEQITPTDAEVITRLGLVHFA